MRIGIFETSHFEVSYTLIRLFDLPGNEITLFTHADTARHLHYLLDKDAEKFRWEIMPEGLPRRNFIMHARNVAKRNRIELMWLSSAEDNFIFYAWLVKRLPGVRTLLTIHDINNYFEYHSNGTLRRYIRNVGKKSLIKAVSEFTVLSSTMEPLLRSKLPEGKTIRIVPGACFDEASYTAPPAQEQYINLVVPGTIDIRRRDYAAVFSLLGYCHQQGIAVRVTLLGGFADPYGVQVLEQVKDYASQHNNLFWYDTPTVEQSEFDKVMQEAHFIFSPTQVSTEMGDGVQEQYGLSKSSGNIGDMIRFARPSIMPKELALDTVWSRSVFSYTDIKEIPDLLLEIRDNPSKYIEMQEQALEASRLFTLNGIRAQHPDLFH